MTRNWRNSLIQTIAAVVVAVEVVVLTALGMFYTEWFSRQLDKGLEESVRIPGALMNRQLLRYQSVSDKAVMTELVGDRFEDGMVVGTDGIIYYAYRPDLLMRPVSSVPGVDPGWFSGESDVPWVLRQTKAGKGYLVSVTPVTAYQGGRPFFHVYVRVATDETEALKFRVFALFVVGSAACVFLTSMVILLFLRQRVTRPLEELERSADNLASGDLDHHVPVHRHDEIGSLARSLDRMRGAIRQKLDELRELNVDLRERKARMKALLDALPDAVFIVDENGRYLEVYTGRAHLLLDDPVAMRGRLMSDFVDPDTAERFMAVVETTLAGESVVLEYPLAVHGGHFWFEGRTARLDREHGEASVIWVSRDITARKHMEERLRQARDVAEAANLRLMELDKAKSGLVSSVSHELRTPLTSLLGFAKLILKNFSRHFLTLAGDDEMLRAKGTRIVDNLNILILEGERLTRLIGDVLDLNKIESGRVEWRDQRIAPGAIAGNAVDAVSGQFAQNPDVELVLDVEPGLPEIEVDPDRLFQVLLNLLNNAAKFTAAGRVILSVSAVSPEMVRFAVSDTGPGIPESELERVFETFHQAVAPDDLSRKPGGAGLGLAISREIVQHYQGRIWVESELGKGSVFLFELSAVS